jgi:RND family efflux transporter MFP subunit
METQLEEVANLGGSAYCGVDLTPQARSLLEGPVRPTLVRVATPTAALLLLQGVIAAGEAAFVERLGSHALAGGLLSCPLVMRILLLALGIGLAGCARVPSQAPAAAPIPVTVSYPVERDVTDIADFTGRTAAVDSVEVRARVSGYLDKVNFKEGALVKKDDMLFEIDPRPYRADLERAKGTVAQYDARVHRLERDYQRAKSLIGRGAIGQEEYDRYEGDYREAVANLDVAKANRDLAALNLDYTRIIAPVSGRVSRYVVTVGNLIQSGDQNGGTLLTTIVSVDPMYVYFDVDERTHLRLRRLLLESRSTAGPGAEPSVPLFLGLADETGFPHQGRINFEDNRLDPTTGTLRVRGVFSNSKRLLSPGLFVRVRLPVGTPYQAILVSEQALGTDQGQKILYLVNEKNEVVNQRVKVGRLHEGLRVIGEGLALGDKVIVNGLQRVQPGAKVEPKLVDMPVRSTTAAAPEAAPKRQ